MFFSGKSKQLPYLSEYLNYFVAQESKLGKKVGMFGGIVGAMGGISGGILGVMLGTGLIQMSNGGLVGTIVGINLAGWLAILAYWMKERQKTKTEDPDQQLMLEAIEVAKGMHSSLNRRRLHKELHPAMADLLEECARNWSRTVGALGNTFWTNDMLPAHWRNVRDTACTAANRAMAELLCLSRTSFNPTNRNKGWEDVVEDVLENFTGPQKRSYDHLPVTYDQGREIAEKMKLLAAEVEKASKDVLEDQTIAQGYRSEAALDMALGELRTIQEAETELRQNLGG